jgi:hypothetical protein
MRLWTHTIHEPPRGRMIWYPRWFFKLYRGPDDHEKTVLAGHIEFVLSKPTTEFGINFEVGTRGSETPFDGYVKLAGTTIYWGVEQGGRLAELITQIWFNRLPNRITRACLDDTCSCPPWQPSATMKRHHGLNGKPYQHRYEGRRFQIRTSEGKLSLEIWTRKAGWSKGEFADWRSRSIKLNPTDLLFGEQRYWYDDVEEQRIVIQLPEAEYPVKAKLQRVRFGRPKLPARHVESWSVDVDAAETKGIPNRYDPSGGWKGDRVWGFGVNLRARRRDWAIDAKAAIEAAILKTRADSGFREPQPLDAG